MDRITRQESNKRLTIVAQHNLIDKRPLNETEEITKTSGSEKEFFHQQIRGHMEQPP